MKFLIKKLFIFLVRKKISLVPNQLLFKKVSKHKLFYDSGLWFIFPKGQAATLQQITRKYFIWVCFHKFKESQNKFGQYLQKKSWDAAEILADTHEYGFLATKISLKLAWFFLVM